MTIQNEIANINDESSKGEDLPQKSSDDGTILLRSVKISRTILLYIDFFFLGATLSFLGPSLLDIQQLTGCSTKLISLLITLRSIGYLVGALLVGLFLKFFNRWLILGISSLISGICMAAAPWCFNIYIQIMVQTLVGICAGEIDAGGNICLLYLWGKENGPWMQALHLLFGVGAMVSPFFVGFFLAEPIEDTDMSHGNYSYLSNYSDNFYNLSNSSIPTMGESYIYIPWGITGILTICICFVFFSIVMQDGCHILNKRKSSAEVNEDNTDVNETKQMKHTRYVLIVFIFTFYLVYCTVEMNVGNFLLTFAVKYLGWSKVDAANLTALFWCAFALSRFIGIFLIKYVSATSIIFGDLIVSIMGFLPLLFLLHHHPAVMLVSAVIIGLGIATIFASGITWTECHITVTDSIGSVFMVAAAASDMYGPILVVFLMEEVSYMSYIYMLFTCVIVCFMLMLVMHYLGSRYVKLKLTQKRSKEDMCANELEPMNSVTC